MRKTNKRYINYSCVNNMHHIDFNGKITSKYNINISKYIPHIIKQLINKIPNRYNTQYIICPYYQQYYDYQIGITETVKFGESNVDTIHRGVNEECGLSNLKWSNYNIINITNWFGVLVNDTSYNYNPNSIVNNNNDVSNKVAVVLYSNLYNLIQTFKKIKHGDINTDGICGIGLISVHDCKKIVNYNL
jgi:hypothetical protein